ncbi:MAG TPA: hypothetical protein VJG32_10695 [Anaerolineae bacterium]|nr:hypothetical protein [Anaerolineae bacterium]
MKEVTLEDLQESVQDKLAFRTLADYCTICRAFLAFVKKTRPTRIVSPSHLSYIFYQYGEAYGHKITRPLNANLFIDSSINFKRAFDRFMTFLADLKRLQKAVVNRAGSKQYIASREINNVPVIAIFLHDVQRAQRGNSIFGINSTFKSNHFLGYTVALNKLDGVYYVDPRPEMLTNARLREQIHDFQQFLVSDLWLLSGG